MIEVGLTALSLDIVSELNSTESKSIVELIRGNIALTAIRPLSWRIDFPAGLGLLGHVLPEAGKVGLVILAEGHCLLGAGESALEADNSIETLSADEVLAGAGVAVNIKLQLSWSAIRLL